MICCTIPRSLLSLLPTLLLLIYSAKCTESLLAPLISRTSSISAKIKRWPRSTIKSFSRSNNNDEYAEAETLLCLHLSCLPGVPIDVAKDRVSKYCQSFPFAAVLPVQPLTYLPTEDNGVEVRFLRRKTALKSGNDGGVRFFIKATSDSDLEVIAKRNAEGQTINKIMAEKLIVLAFIAGITGAEPNRFGMSPVDVVSVESIFHKWL